MFRLSTRLLTVPAVAVVVIAILAANPGDLGTGAAPSEIDAPDGSMNERMAARQEAVQARIGYKDSLIRGLIEGQYSFDAVTAEFARINNEMPVCVGLVRAHFPAATEDESNALNVIEYVRLRASHADVKDRVLADIQCEFALRFGRVPEIKS